MTLAFRSRLRVSADRLREFHASAEALKVLSPPPATVRLLSDGTVRDGALHVIETRLFGLPLGRWEARISDVTDRGFTDTMEKGPARAWRHVHRFLPDGDGSVLEDEVTFEPGVVAPLVRLLFAFRHRATRRALESPESARKPLP